MLEVGSVIWSKDLFFLRQECPHLGLVCSSLFYISWVSCFRWEFLRLGDWFWVTTIASMNCASLFCLAWFIYFKTSIEFAGRISDFWKSGVAEQLSKEDTWSPMMKVSNFLSNSLLKDSPFKTFLISFHIDLVKKNVSMIGCCCNLQAMCVMFCHWNLEPVVVHGKEKDSLVSESILRGS